MLKKKIQCENANIAHVQETIAILEKKRSEQNDSWNKDDLEYLLNAMNVLECYIKRRDTFGKQLSKLLSS